MMDVIQSSVVTAMRVGWQVGVDMQNDRMIDSWRQRAETLESNLDGWRHLTNRYQSERDGARRENARNQELISSLKERETALAKKVADQDAAIKKQTAVMLQKIADLEAQKTRLINEKEREVDVRVARTEELHRVRAELLHVRTSAVSDVDQLKRVVHDQNLKLKCSWARLVGAERVFGRLVAEVVEKVPEMQFEILNDAVRRKILVFAWDQIVSSPAPYKPEIKFTFEPLPL